MSDYSDRKLLRRLQALSEIEVNESTSAQAMDRTRSTIAGLKDKSQIGGGVTFAKIASNPVFWYSAVAILLIGIIIGGSLIWNIKEGNEKTTVVKKVELPKEKPVIEKVEDVKETPVAVEVQQVSEEPARPDIESQLKRLYAMAQAEDIEGLIGVLEEGEFAAKLVAASYLMKIGDQSAIEPLEKLSAEWYGDKDVNPFSAVIEHIRKRIALENEPVATSEPNSIPEKDEQKANKSDKAELSGQYAEITNVHMVQEVEYFDGSHGKGQVWIRLPNCLHEQLYERSVMIIDNGTERLTLNKAKKEAQFSESLMEVTPLPEYWLLDQIETFRGRKQEKDMVLTKIEDESDAKTIVFSVEYGDDTFPASGKVRIERDGMLPTRVEVHYRGDPNSQEVKAGTITLDYSPIPDSFFEMKVPEGYTELASKEIGIFSGRVIDTEGNPVAGVQVHVNSWSLRSSKKQPTGITNADGFFAIRMPPDRDGLLWPVLIRATLPNDPDFMGWTMLQSEEKQQQHELGGEIPGDPGNIDLGGTGTGNSSTGFCSGSSDVVLVLDQAGKIFGRVTDSAGNGLANAVISVEFELADRLGNLAYPSVYFWTTDAITDAQGNYSVGKLPSLWKGCEYLLRIDAEGYVSQRESFTSEGPLDEVRIDLQLHSEGVTVRGILRDNYETLLAEREIYAMVDGKTYTDCSATTEADGSFELVGCPIDERLQVKAELSHNNMPPQEKDKYADYVFYPDVIVDVDYVDDRSEYEVEMIAILPEIVVNVEVVDFTDHPLEYFPVEVRSASGSISSQWKAQRNLTLRTDSQGYCRFENVPNIEDLRIVFAGGSGTWGDLNLNDEEKKFIELIKRQYSIYKWTEVPIEVVPGENEYSVRAVILTTEQYEHKMQKK